MNFEKIKMVKVLELISLHSLKSMIRSNELLHIDTPEHMTYMEGQMDEQAFVDHLIQYRISP